MISLIVKVDSNNLIGDSQRNCMPWEGIDLDPKLKEANSADMKHFVQLRK
jgi:dihydrofolate reductase